MRQTPKSFRGARTCSRSSTTMPSFVGARISPAVGAAKNVEFFVFLSVCSSRFWTSETVHPTSPGRRWSTETGKVCSCAAVFSFLRLLPNGDTTKCRSTKNGKNWGLSPPEGDRIHRSRRNLARKRTPWVCYSTPNLAVIAERGWYSSPQKCQNLSKIVVFGHRKQDIEHIQMKFCR